MVGKDGCTGDPHTLGRFCGAVLNCGCAAMLFGHEPMLICTMPTSAQRVLMYLIIGSINLISASRGKRPGDETAFRRHCIGGYPLTASGVLRPLRWCWASRTLGVA